MKKIYQLSTAIAAITLTLLFAMSVSSFAGGGGPPDPPHTDPENGDMFTMGCAQKHTGALRVADCDLETGEGCLNSEVCVQLPGVKMSCPSLIGGAILVNPLSIVWNNPRHLTYFAGSQDNFADAFNAYQSVEQGGSFKNLNVLLTNPNSPGEEPHRAVTFAFEVNGVVQPALSCSIEGTGDPNTRECTNLSGCVDINQGDRISLLARCRFTNTTCNGTKIKHTVVFDGCTCCDGYPPDENGNCRPILEPLR